MACPWNIVYLYSTTLFQVQSIQSLVCFIKHFFDCSTHHWLLRAWHRAACAGCHRKIYDHRANGVRWVFDRSAFCERPSRSSVSRCSSGSTWDWAGGTCGKAPLRYGWHMASVWQPWGLDGGVCAFQCFFLSRNIGWLTPKSGCLHYLGKYFPDQSIQKTFYFILKTEALVPTRWSWKMCQGENYTPCSE